jgi:hypothetical protein
MRTGLGVVVALALAGCVTTKDAVGGGDARLDESQGADKVSPGAAAKRACGDDAKGDVVVLDARTGGPLTCLPVTLASEAECAAGADCTSTELFKGLTNSRGQVPVAAPFAGVTLVAIADGYGPAALPNATLTQGRVLELELPPQDGFWLKVLDGEGNYLHDVQVTFKAGDEVLFQLKANTLANLFFSEHQPFSGQSVVAQVEGFAPTAINGLEDLGVDGHTLIVKK